MIQHPISPMEGSSELPLHNGSSEGEVKRMKKDPATASGKSVVALKDSDVRIQHGKVFMPNTIEMARLKRPEKGQFKRNVEFSSTMTDMDVRKLLEGKFPFLMNQRFYCAAAVESRSRLDFHGQPRIWNGHFLRQKIKGNSTLYIVADEGAEIAAQVAQISSSSDTGFFDQEMHYVSSNNVFIGVSEAVDSDSSSVPHVAPEHATLFGVVRDIHPKSGSTEGGYMCQINLTVPLASGVTSGAAQFKGIDNNVPWQTLDPYTLQLIVPPSSEAGDVDVTVIDQIGRRLGMTTFRYVNLLREMAKQLVNDKEKQSSFFSMLAQECRSFGNGNNAAQSDNPMNMQNQGQTKQQQSLQLLQLLVYTAAETGAQEFIEMIFSTSAGPIVFNSYKDKTPLPEDVARVNGHCYLAQYLQDVYTRLSKEVGSEVQSKTIDWLELVKTVETQVSAQAKAIKEEKPPRESDDNSSDYFAAAETSSLGSSDVDEANQSDSDSDSSIDKEPCHIPRLFIEELNKRPDTYEEGPSETPYTTENKDALGLQLIASLSQWVSEERTREAAITTPLENAETDFLHGLCDKGGTTGEASVQSTGKPEVPKLKEESVEEGDGKKPSSFGLPLKIPKFIGRNEEWEKITRMLPSDDGDRSRVLNVTGSSGIGKTVVARMMAKRWLDLRRDVLYVGLQKVFTITHAAEKLLEIIGIPVGQSPILQVKQYLASCKRRTVLILDNAEDLQYSNDSAFNGFLKEINEKATNLVTLVTSRSALSNCDDFFPLNFQLRPLTEEQSFLFLKNHAPGITDQEARRLSCNRSCGGVPLFLKVTASFLQSKTIDPAELLRNLQNSPHKFLKAKKQQDVFNLLRVLYNHLQPDLQQALTYLAAFPTDFTKEEAVSVLFWDRDPLEFQILLDVLKCHSLVQQDEVNGSVHYSLHPLVQAFCVASSEETGYRMAIKQFSMHYLSLLQQLNDDFISADCKTAIDKYQMYKTNIHHALMATTEDDLLKHYGLYISTEAVNFLAKVMSMDEFMSCYVKFRDAAEALPDKRLYADCLVSLGFRQLCYYGYKDAHHTEAKRNLQEAHDLQNHLGIHDTECHGHCKCKLGLCTFIAGDQKKGISLIAQGIAVRKKRLHSEGSGKMEHMLVANGFFDLAMAMFNIGKYKAAVNIWENCCLVRYRELMGTHPFTASVLYYSGDAYQKLHLPEEAVKSKKECLQMRRFLLGEEHLDTARAYYGLGCALADLGSPDEALENLSKAHRLQIRFHASKQDIDRTKQEIDRLQFLYPMAVFSA